MSEAETEQPTEPTEPATPEPEPEPEPEEVEEVEQEEAPPPEPEPPSSFADMERKGKQLDNEASRHAKRVAEIMGEDAAELLACPLCWTPGFVWPVEAAPIGDEQRAAVKRAIGEAVEAELRDAEFVEPCDMCNALGIVRTGSKAPGHETLPCRACSGQGYKPHLTPQPPPVLAHDQQGVVAPAPPNGAQGIPPDKFGRPWGHPHFGLEPAQVGA